MTRNSLLLLLTTLAFGPAACGDGGQSTAATDGQSDRLLAAGREPVPAGKLSAPIELDYSITGSPVVGQPVALEVQVTSSLAESPITLHYRMTEPGSMTFPEAQPESMLLAPDSGAERRSQQLTLTPQREGRLFLVVSAEVETDNGTTMKSMSIPVQVGRSTGPSGAAALPVESADGQTGISLPASNPQ